VEEHARQTNLYLQDGKADQVQYETDEEESEIESSQVEEHARQTILYLQDGKADQVQYETDDDEFEDAIQPGNGGPCHQYGRGGAPHQQINTRASGQASPQESVSQTTLYLQDGKKSQIKRSIKKPAARKPSSNREYKLGYFTSWWSRGSELLLRKLR
jgi:hypothetical protein